jgi:putative oxidoreductase
MPDTANAALLILRIGLGVVLFAHGVKHFRNRTGTMRWTESIGFRSPAVQWFFMAFAEIGVGLSLLAGLFTSVGAAGLVALMAVAYWTVHRRAGFWITARPDEGWEYAFVLAVGAAAVALLGPGEWALDHALGIADELRRRRPTGGLLPSSGGVERFGGVVVGNNLGSEPVPTYDPTAPRRTEQPWNR